MWNGEQNKNPSLIANQNGWEINFIHSILKRFNRDFFSPSFRLFDLMFWYVCVCVSLALCGCSFFSRYLQLETLKTSRKSHRLKKPAHGIVNQLAYLFISCSWLLIDSKWINGDFRRGYDYSLSCKTHEIMCSKSVLDDCNLCWISRSIRQDIYVF